MLTSEMAHAVTIRITRRIDVRNRRPDEVGLRIRTGFGWFRPDSLPFPPKLAADCGFVPQICETIIEFPPPGIVAYNRASAKELMLPRSRRLGKKRVRASLT